MAKKTPPLTFRDIVLGAEADTIRQALEARSQIDELIVERQAAYERIAALENQVEDVLGETCVFPFPAPPLPVAGFDPKSATVTRSPAAVKKVVEALEAEAEPEPEVEETTDPDVAEEIDAEVADEAPKKKKSK